MSKEIYVPVDGIAHKVTKVYAPVNGVARSVKKAYKGVGGVARQVFDSVPILDAAFENNSWENIAKACRMGIVPNTWAVGDSMTMDIGGVAYYVNIIGKNHDNYSDGSGKAPLTFQLADCLATEYPMHNIAHNVGGWSVVDMRTLTLPAILAELPLSVRSSIREVKKRTADEDEIIRTTDDKLFLLSEIEVFGDRKWSVAGEGTQYAYYKNGNSAVKYLDGFPTYWWERSTISVSSFAMVNDSGEASNATANYSCGVSFAFCF